MTINQSTTKKDFWYLYLWFLDPILKLNDTERKILSGYLTLHYYHRHRYSDLNALNEILFSDITKKHLMKVTKLKEDKFNKSYESLVLKNAIQEYTADEEQNIRFMRIHPSLTKYPRNNKFELDIKFNIQ